MSTKVNEKTRFLMLECLRKTGDTTLSPTI